MIQTLCLLISFLLFAQCLPFTTAGVHQFKTTLREIPFDSPQYAHRLQHAKQIRSTSGGGNVTNYHFYLIYANISLGTPPQNFTVAMDRDQDDWWVLGADANYTDVPGNRNKTRFFANQSTTYIDSGTRFGSRSNGIAGELGSDTWAFGNLTLSPTNFGVADTAPSWLGKVDYDSWWGIRISSNASTALNTVLSQLDSPILTTYTSVLNYVQDGNGTGVVTFGGEDLTTCNAPYTYIPLYEKWKNYWSLPLRNASIGGVVVGSTTKNLTIDRDNSGFWTTNNTGVQIAALYGAIYNETKGDYGMPYDIDCGQISNTSVNSLTVELNFDAGSNGLATLSLTLRDFFFVEDGQCSLNVYPTLDDDDDYDDWNIGQPFLSYRCMAYNAQQYALGFADVKDT